MSPGNAPTLLMRLPSITMASLRADGFPELSISVPLRITRVFLAALMGLSGYFVSLIRLYNSVRSSGIAAGACGGLPAAGRGSLIEPGQAIRRDKIADLIAAGDMGVHHRAKVAVELGGRSLRPGLELGAEIGAFH